MPSKSYDLCTCQIWSCYVQQFRRRWVYKKIFLYDLDLSVKVTQNVAQYHPHHVIYAPVNFEVQWFRRRFIYKTIHYLTLGYLTLTPRSRSYEVLPSTLNILWPMHRQNLKLLLPKHYEEMRFQESTLFDLDLGVKVTRNVTQYPWHHVTYAQAKFEVATSISLPGDAFTRKYIIWPLTLTLGSRSHEMSPSTLYIMWSIHLQSLKLLPPTV